MTVVADYVAARSIIRMDEAVAEHGLQSRSRFIRRLFFGLGRIRSFRHDRAIRFRVRGNDYRRFYDRGTLIRRYLVFGLNGREVEGDLADLMVFNVRFRRFE